jgi:hypothetical protein
MSHAHGGEVDVKNEGAAVLGRDASSEEVNPVIGEYSTAAEA